MHKQLVDFFSGKTDDKGRTLDFILKQDDAWWETTHDFVQWIFPTPVPSRFNPIAPFADAETYAILARGSASTSLQCVDEAFDRFIRFLKLRGLERPAWWQKANHNHLRVSRCLLFLDYLDTLHTDYLACALRIGLKDMAKKWPDGCTNDNLKHWGVRILGREMI